MGASEHSKIKIKILLWGKASVERFILIKKELEHELRRGAAKVPLLIKQLPECSAIELEIMGQA